MKKFILQILLFLMFIPFVVNAETCDTDKITISSITIESKSDNAEEIEEATSSGKNIYLNLSMSEVGDNIEYKFVVKNDSNEDYELDKTSLNLNSDYINYSFETDDNSNIVRANSSKTVVLRVEYKNEVPEDKFENGTYNDNKTMIVQLSNGQTINVPNTFKNPNTGVQSYILILAVVLVVSGTLYVLLKQKKYTKIIFLAIGTAIMIPMSVYALCKCDLIVESNIVIEKNKKCKSFAEDDWETIKSNIKNNCYSVGDTKKIDIGELGNHTVRIANMSTPNECDNNTFSQTACGFVIEFEDIIYQRPFMNRGTNNGGWPASYLRNYLNSDLMEILPEDLKKIIIETKVISGHGPTEGEENFTTYDKIYPLSVVELYGENNSSDTVKLNETRQLDYYHLNNVSLTNYSFLKKLETENHYYDWYLRSPSSINLNGILIVTSAGRLLVTYPSNYAGISPAFRIG